MFRPPTLLAPRIVSTAAIPRQGSRGFLHLSYSMVLSRRLDAKETGKRVDIEAATSQRERALRYEGWL